MIGFASSPLPAQAAQHEQDEGSPIIRKRRADTRALLQQALESARRVEPQPLELEANSDEGVRSYEGWSALMRIMAAIHKGLSIENMLPGLDAFLIDRACISHRNKEVRRPVVHLLFGATPSTLEKYEHLVKRAIEKVNAAEKGAMVRVHATDEFLFEHRKRLSSFFPVYLTIKVQGLCPSVLEPGPVKRAIARIRHPVRGYGDYPKGPGW